MKNYAIHLKRVRDKLVPRSEPYWQPVAAHRGLSMGYRKAPSGRETWHCRDLSETPRFARLDTLANLSFEDATKRALEWAKVKQGSQPDAPKTVADLVPEYIKTQRRQKRIPKECRKTELEWRCARLIENDPIGKARLDRLTPVDIGNWLDRQDTKNANSTNRDLATLKAVLNFAAEQRWIANDSAWRHVKRLTSEVPQEKDYLELEEWIRLLEHCEEDLAAIVRGMLHTAARPKELREAKANDLDLRQGVITLRGYKGKDGKLRTRKVPLSKAAKTFFRQHICSVGDASLFTRADGTSWPKEWLNKQFREARAAAGFGPHTTPYSARHSTITNWCRSGMDVNTVAKMAGTSPAIIAKHYFKAIPKHVKDLLDSVAFDG